TLPIRRRHHRCSTSAGATLGPPPAGASRRRAVPGRPPRRDSLRSSRARFARGGDLVCLPLHTLRRLVPPAFGALASATAAEGWGERRDVRGLRLLHVGGAR